MTVKTRIIAAFLAVLMLLPLCACEKEYPESENDNKLALAGYLEFFEVPGDVEIKELEKYVFAKETVYRVLRSK